jgi:hypothetical protein
MLKILNFFKSTTGETKIISMRERFENAQSELNAVLAEMHDMPSLTIDATARRIDLTAPEQFADEALALPAPEPEADVKTEEEAKPEEASEASSETADAKEDKDGEIEKSVAA